LSPQRSIDEEHAGWVERENALLAKTLARTGTDRLGRSNHEPRRLLGDGALALAQCPFLKLMDWRPVPPEYVLPETRARPTMGFSPAMGWFPVPLLGEREYATFPGVRCLCGVEQELGAGMALQACAGNCGRWFVRFPRDRVWAVKIPTEPAEDADA
jgi:hypothetical protein